MNLVKRAKTSVNQTGGRGYIPDRFRNSFSRSPTMEDKKKSVFDDVCFICSFLRG